MADAQSSESGSEVSVPAEPEAVPTDETNRKSTVASLLEKQRPSAPSDLSNRF